MAKDRIGKMYGNSPRIVPDENGKKVLRRGPTEAEKLSSEVNSGTSGIPINGDDRGMEKERLELFQKHAKEYMDLHTKYTAATPKDTTKGDA